MLNAMLDQLPSRSSASVQINENAHLVTHFSLSSLYFVFGFMGLWVGSTVSTFPHFFLSNNQLGFILSCCMWDVLSEFCSVFRGQP